MAGNLLIYCFIIFQFSYRYLHKGKYDCEGSLIQYPSSPGSRVEEIPEIS